MIKYILQHTYTGESKMWRICMIIICHLRINLYTTIFSLICQVSWSKRYSRYSILKPTCVVTTEHGGVQNTACTVYLNTLGYLYITVVLFTLHFKTVLYHLASYLLRLLYLFESVWFLLPVTPLRPATSYFLYEF